MQVPLRGGCTVNMVLASGSLVYLILAAACATKTHDGREETNGKLHAKPEASGFASPGDGSVKATQRILPQSAELKLAGDGDSADWYEVRSCRSADSCTLQTTTHERTLILLPEAGNYQIELRTCKRDKTCASTEIPNINMKTGSPTHVEMALELAKLRASLGENVTAVRKTLGELQEVYSTLGPEHDQVKQGLAWLTALPDPALLDILTDLKDFDADHAMGQSGLQLAGNEESGENSDDHTLGKAMLGVAVTFAVLGVGAVATAGYLRWRQRTLSGANHPPATLVRRPSVVQVPVISTVPAVESFATRELARIAKMEVDLEAVKQKQEQFEPRRETLAQERQRLEAQTSTDKFVTSEKAYDKVLVVEEQIGNLREQLSYAKADKKRIILTEIDELISRKAVLMAESAEYLAHRRQLTTNQVAHTHLLRDVEEAQSEQRRLENLLQENEGRKKQFQLDVEAQAAAARERLAAATETAPRRPSMVVEVEQRLPQAESHQRPAGDSTTRMIGIAGFITVAVAAAAIPVIVTQLLLAQDRANPEELYTRLGAEKRKALATNAKIEQVLTRYLTSPAP